MYVLYVYNNRLQKGRKVGNDKNFKIWINKLSLMKNRGRFSENAMWRM